MMPEKMDMFEEVKKILLKATSQTRRSNNSRIQNQKGPRSGFP